MTSENNVTKDISDSRRSVALTEDTILKLKNFSKHNSLKIYEVIDTMIDITSEDADISERVIKLTKDRAKIKQDIKQSKREVFTQKIDKLPHELQSKLMKLSSDELATLLEKLG